MTGDIPVIGGPHNRTSVRYGVLGNPYIVGDEGHADHEYRGHWVFWLDGAWRIAPRTREWNRGGGYGDLKNAHHAIARTHWHQREGRKVRDCEHDPRAPHATARPA